MQVNFNDRQNFGNNKVDKRRFKRLYTQNAKRKEQQVNDIKGNRISAFHNFNPIRWIRNLCSKKNKEPNKINIKHNGGLSDSKPSILNKNNQVVTNTQIVIPSFVTEFGENLYRGRRPEKDEFPQLQKMGITTIVDFSTEPSNYNEAEVAAKHGMEYVKLPFDMSNIIKSAPIKQFLDVIDKNKEKKGKLYVHCLQGTDRTGVMVNLYKLNNGLPLDESNMINNIAKCLYNLNNQ